jgi:Tfp pilus assembly protein PilV
VAVVALAVVVALGAMVALNSRAERASRNAYVTVRAVTQGHAVCGGLHIQKVLLHSAADNVEDMSATSGHVATCYTTCSSAILLAAVLCVA